MSTLWTPGGERPIRREPESDPGSAPGPGGRPSGGPGGGPGGGSSGGPGGGSGGGPGDEFDGSGREQEPTEEELRAELDAIRGQLARTPPEVVVANHAFGLFELAALHLSLDPPQLPQARLAIDALAALVEGLGDRLGAQAGELAAGLSELRMAFVQIHRAHEAGAGGNGDAGGGEEVGRTEPSEAEGAEGDDPAS